MLVVCLLSPAMAAAQQPSGILPQAPLPAGQAPLEPVPVPTPRAPLTATGLISTIDSACGGSGASGVRVIPGPDYRLGPSDQLEVQIAGRLEVSRQQMLVNPEGVINIPPIGTVDVQGKTLAETQRAIGDLAHTVLRFVDVSVSVVSPRCIQVPITGEVEQPG